MARRYVTTPIYYANDAPHIGHAYTTVIADGLARWHRLCGHDVRFLTGTDEHGLKMQRAADVAGRSPIEHADSVSQRYRDTWAALDISHDDFIRTTEPRHERAVQSLLQRVYDNGHVYADTYAGWYCVSCEAYYNEDELGPGHVCPDHGRPAEWLEEQNYFFALSRFGDRLAEWLSAQPSPVGPSGKRNEALGLVRGGLDDVSITRTSLDWGVRVPWDDRHVFYVWYDALINYVTAAGYPDDVESFDRWWPDVHHLIGKDILRFHCVYWPAMLMAAGLAPPKRVSVHGFLLVGGEKMSKTRLNQISPTDLVADFGVDGFRYHFLSDQPFGTDGDFSYEGMVSRYNTDLANNVGNLVARTVTVVTKKCHGRTPAPDPESPLAELAAATLASVSEAWEAMVPSRAFEAILALVRATNSHLEENEPWKMEPGEAVDRVMGDAVEVLRWIAVLASPALVNTSPQMWARIGLDGTPSDVELPDGLVWGAAPTGRAVVKGGPLFPRLTP